MKTLVAVAASIALLVYAAFLTTSNDMPVDIDLLFAGVQAVPLWQGLLASFVAGALLVGMASLWSIARLRLSVRRQTRAIARLEQEVHGLRTLPLEDKPQAASASAQKG
jgi:uncharacterized integral membrane protein